MISPKDIMKSISTITYGLIGYGLSIDQNFPSEKNEKGLTIISWGDISNLSIVLKNIEYKQIYNELLNENNFNIKLIDGALIQMMYTFDGNELISHRLAFFPSPELESYQNDPDIYEHQELYADIIAKNILPSPIRFDYSISEELFESIVHPRCHVTLGQYPNCRIPVSAPLTPSVFVDFILRNFYSTAFYYYQMKPDFNERFESTITTDEKLILHMNIK